MGDVLKTADGTVTILSKYDLIDLIRSHISDDVADYVDKHFREDDNEEELNKMYLNSDYHAMEASCDEYTHALSEVMLICGEVKNLLEEKRLNRKLITDKIKFIENAASEVL